MKKFPMRLPFLALLSALVAQAADSPVTQPMNSFTIDAYKQLASHGPENLIVSPFNIAAALAMAREGARGQTAVEMEMTLHLPKTGDFASQLAELSAAFEKSGNGNGNEFKSANSLWLQKSLSVESAFLAKLRDSFHAPPSLVDFAKHPEQARHQINAWVDQQTKSKIKDLLPPESVDHSTQLVLASAIYFFGRWDDPFSVKATQPAPFTPIGGTAVDVQFMHQTGQFLYAETPTAQILEKSYAGSGFAFDVVLPSDTNSLEALEKSLQTGDLASQLLKLRRERVEVSLPKFKAESRFEMRKDLSSLGMPTAFGRGADFSGITTKEKLEISEVVHKAFIDVSELGTEAAAATATVMVRSAALPAAPPKVFRADHPFLFMIRDTKTGTILFIGRLMKPEPISTH